jgi:hypothetical protein
VLVESFYVTTGGPPTLASIRSEPTIIRLAGSATSLGRKDARRATPAFVMQTQTCQQVRPEAQVLRLSYGDAKTATRMGSFASGFASPS